MIGLTEETKKNETHAFVAHAKSMVQSLQLIMCCRCQLALCQ